jgi:TfoX/Sxy family transcriptional regulator of competence genes
MAYDQKAAERVRRALVDGPDVVERKMMGAICFMVRGNMVCGVTGDALMVRVGREAQDKALTLPHVRPMEIGQRQASGYVLVDPEGYRTTAALAAWVRRGIAFASTLPARKSASRKTRRKA